MDKVEKKRQREQCVVEEMIRLYCRKNVYSGDIEPSARRFRATITDE